PLVSQEPDTMAKESPTYVTDPRVWEIIGDAGLLDPPRRRKTWTNSRLVVRNEREAPIPLLHVLAEHVYGPWDPHAVYPVWRDMDYTNESPDNVMLVSKSAGRLRAYRNNTG